MSGERRAFYSSPAAFSSVTYRLSASRQEGRRAKPASSSEERSSREFFGRAAVAGTIRAYSSEEIGSTRQALPPSRMISRANSHQEQKPSFAA